MLATLTAEVLPLAPGDGFSAELVVEALSAIVVPTVIGAYDHPRPLPGCCWSPARIAISAGVALSARGRQRSRSARG